MEVIIPAPPASASYLDITVDVMQAFRAGSRRTGYERFLCQHDRPVQGTGRIRSKGDYSSASYFFAIAAICGGRVTVENLVPGSVQGDRRFPDALAAMGCTVIVRERFGHGRTERGSPRDHLRHVVLPGHRPDALHGRRGGDRPRPPSPASVI